MLIFILFACALAYTLYFSFGLVNHDFYTKETGEYLKMNTAENDIIIGTKILGYYSERKIYINDNNKPDVNLSADYILGYLRKSYYDRQMKNEFFWPKGLYSGLWGQLGNLGGIDRAKYVVLYHPVQGLTPEKVIGDFYIYRA